MPSVDFGGCLSNYWFVWSINGLGSVFGLAINMAVSFFFLKYFHNMQGVSAPSAPAEPSASSNFDSVASGSPTPGTTRV